MKFDLTFLLHSNEKTSFDSPLKCPMPKYYPSSLGSDPVSQSDDTDGDNDHNILASSMGTSRSTSIPLPASHVPKTQSELQLCIDEEAAEQRDARMFYRLVNGIRERQQQQHTEALTSVPCANSFDQSISRIVQARLAPLREVDRAGLQETRTDESVSEHIEFSQEASDAWSISGYEQEEQTSFQPYSSNQEEQQQDACPEEEGFFEMDL